MKKRKVFFVMVLVVVIIVAIMIDWRLKVVSYKVLSDKISNGFKIALITDLHGCKYGYEQKNLITAIDEQNPDIVLLGGDIFDDVVPYEYSEYLLKGIADKYECYYVTGNHEYWSYDVDNILSYFDKYNIEVLHGESKIINLNGEEVNLCGVDDVDVTKYYDNTVNAYEQIRNLSTVYGNGYYTILLSHRPELVDIYKNSNFDLVLSGHAHGGQWRIPYLINGLFAPNQGFFPKYAGGRYDFDEMVFIVSRGLATWSTKVPRVFNRPELVIVDVLPS
ncbi:MAG: metallophosphoesterase [Lachnospirales bacterium]